MVGGSLAGLAGARVEAEIADELRWIPKRRTSPMAAATPDATAMSTPGSVISRRMIGSDMVARAISASTSLSDPPMRSIRARVATDGGALVVGQALGGDPLPPADPGEVPVRAGRDEVRMQDGLNEVLQPDPLAY
jgi:hypothetical protein